MASHFVVAIFAFLAASCAASSLREKRQVFQQPPQNNAYFNCPSDGPFSDPDDCSKFFLCYNGLPNRKDCPQGLEFNPENRWCDFPANVNGNGCRRVSQSSAVNSPCLNGNIQAAGFVEHPSFCNAFFHCGNGLLYPQCTFCGEGSYFDVQVKDCVSYRGDDVGLRCSGREMVYPIDQEVRRLEQSCHPGQNYTFAPLLAKIRGGNYFPGNNQGNNFPVNNFQNQVQFQNQGFNENQG